MTTNAKVTDVEEAALREYAAILSSYAGRIRLTGPSDPELIYREHIEDSLAVMHLLPAAGRVIDVGSGGGLPGMAWAICRPGLQVVLLDSIAKKCAALLEISVRLGLRNVQVLCARCEEHAAECRESYSAAAARAVSSLDVVLEYLAPLVAPGGRLIAFKGANYAEEMRPMLGLWETLGLSDPEVERYLVNGKERYALSWEKIAPTPERYPRRVGAAEKSRWWRGVKR